MHILVELRNSLRQLPSIIKYFTISLYLIIRGIFLPSRATYTDHVQKNCCSALITLKESPSQPFL